MKYKVTTDEKEYFVEVENMCESDFGKYPSASVLLELAKDEYSKERERTDSLDNKASVFIAAIIAMITAFVPIIPFCKLVDYYSGNGRTEIGTICLCILVGALTMLIIAFFMLYKAID